MSSSTLITDYLSEGTHAARPTAPAVPTGGLAFYYETDTTHLFYYDKSTSAWIQVTAGGGGGATVAALSPHRYWKLAFPVIAGGYFALSVAEIEYHSTIGGSNIATGGTASANDVGGGAAANAFDGNPATYWGTASGSGQAVTEYLTITYDFGTTVSVREIKLTARNDGGVGAASQMPQYGSVMFSDDGTNYVTAWSFDFSSLAPTVGYSVLSKMPFS